MTNPSPSILEKCQILAHGHAVSLHKTCCSTDERECAFYIPSKQQHGQNKLGTYICRLMHGTNDEALIMLCQFSGIILITLSHPPGGTLTFFLASFNSLSNFCKLVSGSWNSSSLGGSSDSMCLMPFAPIRNSSAKTFFLCFCRTAAALIGI